MSAGKIILLVFGIIILLISFALIAGGATLLRVNARDKGGFLTSETLRIQRDSHAVVAGPIEIDEVGLRVLRSLGVITVFEFEGKNNNPSKQIFMGVADQSQLDDYLNNVSYDEVTSFDFGWRVRFDSVAYVNHAGSSSPPAPASQPIWNISVAGTSPQKLTWQTEVGSHSIVLMNHDGSRGVDLDVIFRTKIPSVLRYGVGFLVGGIVLLVVGGLMAFFALRRTP